MFGFGKGEKGNLFGWSLKSFFSSSSLLSFSFLPFDYIDLWERRLRSHWICHVPRLLSRRRKCRRYSSFLDKNVNLGGLQSAEDLFDVNCGCDGND